MTNDCLVDKIKRRCKMDSDRITSLMITIIAQEVEIWLYI